MTVKEYITKIILEEPSIVFDTHEISRYLFEQFSDVIAENCYIQLFNVKNILTIQDVYNYDKHLLVEAWNDFIQSELDNNMEFLVRDDAVDNIINKISADKNKLDIENDSYVVNMLVDCYDTVSNIVNDLINMSHEVKGKLQNYIIDNIGDILCL